MRQIALLLTAFAVACFGITVSEKFCERVRMLKSVCLFLGGIRTEIEFSLESAADIFERLAPIYSDDLPFCSACREKLLKGTSFADAWNGSLADRENTKALKKEDISLLISFGKSFGTTDIDGQKANCDMHVQLIKSNLVKAENEMKLYRRPAAAIGILSGAAVYILLM